MAGNAWLRRWRLGPLNSWPSWEEALKARIGRRSITGRYRSYWEGALGGIASAGFWDASKNRFVDWVDRNSVSHDHIHLLAIRLPSLFHYTKPEQEDGVDRLMEECFLEFQRFPSFVSAQIADYTGQEIGSGGPYDLCAAGKIWCWDLEYWREGKKRYSGTAAVSGSAVRPG